MSPTIRTLALAIPLLAALAPAPASAIVANPTTTFNFTGTCTDCTGTVTGELTLSGYTYGQTISSTNFVSFHYDGSNYMSPFTISGPFVTLGGSINNNLPGPEEVHVANSFFTSGYFFDAYTDGTWHVGTVSPIIDLDNGITGTFSLPGATAVPEPASLALLSAGLLGVRLLRRRRPAA